MRRDFEADTYRQYRIKALEHRTSSFENGAEYIKLRTGRDRMRSYYEGRIRQLKNEVSGLERELTRMLDKWYEVFEDVCRECEKRIAGIEKELKASMDREAALKARISVLKAEMDGKTSELIAAREKCIEEQEKSHAMEAQLNQDFENSSIPSSKVPFRGKVPNNREKTDRKPGGQPGHEGHRRKKHGPTDSRFIPAPKEITCNDDYYIEKEADGSEKVLHRQVIGISLDVTVTDYWTYSYRNRKTGKRYHAPFPGTAVKEVNYDENVKGLILIMKDYMDVSEEKISGMIEMLTDGKLKISRGMINRTNREFSDKSAPEREGIIERLRGSAVMHTDLTGVRVDGKQKNIVVCTDKTDTAYFYREHKGDRAFEGTPVEGYKGILVHDHDKTMYHYGSGHQECNAHHLRYLKGAMEMENNLTWHKDMRELLQEMNRTREAAPGRILSEEQTRDFETRYDAILDTADKEYYDNPPSEYYRKGYNLSVEFREYKEAILLFLHDPTVDFTNNEAERRLRAVKQHMNTSGTFRSGTGGSEHSAAEYCSCISVLSTLRAEGGNLLKKAAEIFARPTPKAAAVPTAETQQAATG